MVADPRRIDVYMYGLFMDESLLRGKGANPVNRRQGFLEGFALVVGNRAALVPEAARRVHGIVFSLTHGELDNLYSEDSLRDYRPEAVSVQLTDGIVIPALCFNLPAAPSARERNPQYVSKLGELAARIGLPADYVASIERMS